MVHENTTKPFYNMLICSSRPKEGGLNTLNICMLQELGHDGLETN